MTAERGGRIRLAYVAAASSLVVCFAASGSPVPLYNVYRAESGLTNADVSVTVVTYFAGTIIALLSLGRLANHLGRRPASLVTVLLLIAGCLVLLHVPNVVPLAAGRFLMGLGCGLASSALMAYVVDTAPGEPPWLASVTTAQAPLLGLTIGALTSGALVEHGPAPRVTVYVVMAALLVVCVALLLASPETGERSPGLLASLRPRASLPRHTYPLLPVAISIAVSTWAMGAFYQAFSPSITADQLRTRNAVVVALVFAAYMAPSVLSAPLSGRFTPAAAQRVGMVVFVIGMAGIIAALLRVDIVLFLVATVVAGMGQGVAFSATIRALLHRITFEQRAPTLAAIYLISYLGAMVPSLVSGQLTRVVGLVPIATGYAVLALLATVVTLIWAREPA